MTESIRKIKIIVNRLKTAGFTNVFGASVINKVLLLVTNMLIVRIVTKADYGYYSFAFNIISIIVIVSDIGTRGTRLQYCCETEDRVERKAITLFLLKVGTISNIAFVIATFLYATFCPLSIPQAKTPLQLLSFFFLFQFFYDQACYRYRIEKDNRRFALLTNINTIAYFAFSCVGAYFLGIPGLALGRYLAFLIPIIVCLIFINGERSNNLIEAEKSFVLSSEKKKSMIKYGLLIMITNCVSSVLHYFDTLLVGIVIADELVLADYKVAVTIPNALNFIPAACITFIYPYFVKHKDDYAWLKKNTRRVQLGLAIPSILIAVGGSIFAPLIMRLVFGAQYESAASIFVVLMITYVFTALFRTVYGNILAMMHKVKANFILSSAECAINIVLDVVLIKRYGSIGAAYATLVITVLSSLLSGFYYRHCLKQLNTQEKINI